jgi:hypothetical protein
VFVSSEEKSSSSSHQTSQILEFGQTLATCQLEDLGYSGPKFTWTNGRSGRDLTRERLDRAVANNSWSNHFNVVEVVVLPRIISDHNPLLLSCSQNCDLQWKKHKSFRYEASWAKHQDHEALVQKA